MFYVCVQDSQSYVKNNSLWYVVTTGLFNGLVLLTSLHICYSPQSPIYILSPQSVFVHIRHSYTSDK